MNRSHVFSIQARTPDLVDKKIFNLNVRGKRGNIVQVYPSVEYDFVPNRLVTSKNDFIHIQWTGSNTNPQNNDGQGLAGTDRNNMVLIGPKRFQPVPTTLNGATINGHYGANLFLPITNVSFLSFDKNDLTRLALLQLSKRVFIFINVSKKIAIIN